MARKNLLEGLLGTPADRQSVEKLPAGNSALPAGVAPPLPSPPPLSQSGAIGSVSRSIEALRSEAQEARALRHQIEAGQAVVEIEPSRIVSSIIADRLAQGGESLQALVEIHSRERATGARSATPSPRWVGSLSGRLWASPRAGRPRTRATRARGDPPVERCRACSSAGPGEFRPHRSVLHRALAFRGASRRCRLRACRHHAALAIDKTALSKLIAVARRVPEDIIEAIGPAPKAGRDRWLQLADRLQGVGSQDRARGLLAHFAEANLPSDERFQRVFVRLAQAPEPAPTDWIVPQVARERGKALEIEDGEFRAYLRARLEDLYREFRNR